MKIPTGTSFASGHRFVASAVGLSRADRSGLAHAEAPPRHRCSAARAEGLGRSPLREAANPYPKPLGESWAVQWPCSASSR